MGHHVLGNATLGLGVHGNTHDQLVAVRSLVVDDLLVVLLGGLLDLDLLTLGGLLNSTPGFLQLLHGCLEHFGILLFRLLCLPLGVLNVLLDLFGLLVQAQDLVLLGTCILEDALELCRTLVDWFLLLLLLLFGLE